MSVRLFKETGKQYLQGSAYHSRSWKAHFGIGVEVCATAWNFFQASSLYTPDIKPLHLLWLLHWLKTYSTWDVLCNELKVDPKTARKYIYGTLARFYAIFIETDLVCTILSLSCTKYIIVF